MKSKVTNIKVVAKNKDHIIYEENMGQAVDIVYKTKDALSQMEVVMLASYPNSLVRAIGGMASLISGIYSEMEIGIPDDCEVFDMDILIFSEGNEKPDNPKIKCTGAAFIPAHEKRLKLTTPKDLICIGMDSREAIGAIHLIEFQQLISSAMNGFLQQMMGRGPGPGGQDLRNLLKKPHG